MGVFAVADLHGNGEMWVQVRSFLKREDTLYVLGDAADRGPNGWAIIKDILETPNIKYLLGNHDVMLLDTFVEDFDGFGSHAYWNYNGSFPTYTDIQEDKNADKYLKELAGMPYYYRYENTKGDIIHLTHAGFDPDREISELNDLVWDRSHLVTKEWRGADNEYCVFGHTPVPNFREGAVEVKDCTALLCGGHKIDIDSGCFATDELPILNLDTLEVERICKYDRW